MTLNQPPRLAQAALRAPAADSASPTLPDPAAPYPPQDAPRTGFVYDGKLGELYGIFFVNLLWTILTLTIFRFWAKTRIRRYLWSRTSLNGDRFEYTGTGGELFIGFLIVAAAYVIASIGIQILGIFVEPGSPVLFVLQMLLLVAVLYLTFVAQYAAQRYRLTRTLWRGISGGMTGSAWAWGFKGMWFSILSLLSLTLAWPWAQMRLLDDRLNNSYFGDAKASIRTSSKPLYLPFIAANFGSMALAGIIVFIGYLFLQSQYGDALTEIFARNDTSEHAADYAAALNALLIVIGIGYLAFFVIAIIAFAAYYRAMAHEVANHLTLGGLRFSTTVTAGRIISRYLGNVLIIVFTLGLGLPIAIHRTMQFFANNIVVIGEIEGSDITHANLPRPRLGEGLLEAFDPGIL